MAVLDVMVGARKMWKLFSAAVAAVLALPGLMFAQAQRMTGDWLLLTPSDPKAGIPSDPRTTITAGTDGAATTVSIERRIHARSRRDSLAAATAYEASKRDEHL